MKGKILVVEDDIALAAYATEILKREEYEVEQVYDGKEGVEKALSYLPDLIVLDLMLPGMHGIQVCEKLREKTGSAGPRILITSSKSYDTDIQEAKNAGADDYLTKPYKAEDLRDKVRELLGRDCRSAPEQAALAAGESGSFSRSVAVKGPVESAPVSGSAETEVKVRFWGTRGSSPAPGPDTVRYGGNTVCTELRIGGRLVIIDCGSGIRELGVSLLKEFGDKPIEGHIFVGHTHWDHIQGFPFFTPFYVKRNNFSVYSVHGAGKSLGRVFSGQMAADYFPVPLTSLACQLRFFEMEGPIEIGLVRVRYHFLNHPGIAIGFRFEAYGKSVTYISDHESYRRLNGDSDITRKQDKAIVEFARDSDILVCEAQYTEEEYNLKRGWGHSTFNDAVDRGLAAGCKHLVLFHHDPVHTDEMMDQYLDECQERVRQARSPLLCTAARERQSISV
ncbi:MAG: response regulator [Elusimicrobiota bacterium]